MKLLAVTALVSLLAEAAPAVLGDRATCSNPLQRKAWHTLTREEKLAYIAAEKCLMKLPAKGGFAGSRTRFDDLQKLHILATETVHFVGAFLPFHRYFIHAHETMLRTECNYTGAQPYWDEALDAGNFTHSAALDPVTGFGGNGSGRNGCIADGPFKDYVNSFGPYKQVTDHCIDRKLDECQSAWGAKHNVDECLAMSNYATFWPCVELRPHVAGHGGVGGEMTNVWSSPGDPLFYLHHTYLDYLWSKWQNKDSAARRKDISGTNKSFLEGGGGLPPQLPGGCPGSPGGNMTALMEVIGTPSAESIAAPVNGDPGNVTTLGHVLTLFGVMANVTIADVMDVQGGLLCYKYA